MAKIVMFSYFNGKVLKTMKLNEKASNTSITYQPEGDRFVVRSYWTGEKLQSCKAPEGSYSYEYEEDEDED